MEMIKQVEIEHNPDVNAQIIKEECDWIIRIRDLRIQTHFNKEEGMSPKLISGFITPPNLQEHEGYYAAFVCRYNLNEVERLVIAMALMARIQQSFFKPFFAVDNDTNHPFPDTGGIRKNNGRFLPTVETALFIVAGKNTSKQLEYQSLFDPDHLFYTQRILEPLSTDKEGERIINLTDEAFRLMTQGKELKPEYSSNFPASRIETALDWEDLVTEAITDEDIEELKLWLMCRHQLSAHQILSKKLTKGYRCLFYGPSGTGKTLAASLLGKQYGMDVYRVDLSMIVSKYIGETEKNLSNIFDKAEDQNWILFFDEGDALFGKRVNTSSSNDRYANQEISYLLQRIENYNGLIVLASNYKVNMDDAFIRRFQSLVHFPMPKPRTRLELWKKAFEGSLQLEDKISLWDIAKKNELAGGAIANVLRYCALKAFARESDLVLLDDLEAGIKKELRKDGKSSS